MSRLSRSFLWLLALTATALTAACSGPYVRMPYGIVGLVVLIADIWAIIEVIQSGKSTGNKVLWVLLIVVFPIVGVILYFLLGRGR